MKFLCFAILIISMANLSYGYCIEPRNQTDSQKRLQEVTQPLGINRNVVEKSGMERLENLIAEAEEIKSMYAELMRTIFGPKLNVAEEEDEPVVGGPRKAVAGAWVRSTINTALLNQRNQNQN